MATQSVTGKAFEYALITEANNILSARQVSTLLVADAAYTNAKSAFDLFAAKSQRRYVEAATAAINHIILLEPRLTNSVSGTDKLHLQLMPDSAGARGDVRDVLFVRSTQNNWEIGISAKNNHNAVKHSRLSDKLDFGAQWVGVNCSPAYFAAILPVFTPLRTLKAAGAAWKNLANKHATYYKPVLDAFRDEMLLLNKNNPATVPGRLVSYLLGTNDFYKVVKRPRVVEILGFNLNGTLNRSMGSLKPAIKVPQLKLPTNIIQLTYKAHSTDTLELTCDQGWQISFRIHNAETLVVPSLKFDINLIGHPHSIYSNHIPY